MGIQYTLLLTMILCQGNAAPLAEMPSNAVMNDFQMDSCNQKNTKCISVRAIKAESGSTTPNMMLKNVLVKIIDSKTKKETQYSKAIGFYDVANQRILISELTPKKTLKETVFLISDASVSHMEMK